MEAIDSWAQAAQGAGFAADMDSPGLSAAVQSLLDQETSFAEQNAKRLNLVRQALQQEEFGPIIKIVDRLVGPLDIPMNKLLKRSVVLRSLRFQDFGKLGSEAELRAYAKSTYLAWVSGAWGAEVISGFLARLASGEFMSQYMQTFGRSSVVEALQKTCFSLALFGISDTWRRLSFPTQGFPYQMFNLLSCNSVSEFITMWHTFQKKMQTCERCFDVGFSAPLLRTIHFLDEMPQAEKQNHVKHIQELLADIATYSPMATDSVEALHGQHQNMLAAFRGKLKSPETASQDSVLHSLKREHAALRLRVDADTLPPRFAVACLARNLGRRAGKLTIKNHDMRRRIAARAKLRALSPWNVFQREKMQRFAGKIPPGVYKQTVRQWSREWHTLSSDQKQKYVVQARFEQFCRETLAHRPLACGPKKDKRISSAEPVLGGGQQGPGTEQLEALAGLDF